MARAALRTGRLPLPPPSLPAGPAAPPPPAVRGIVSVVEGEDSYEARADEGTDDLADPVPDLDSSVDVSQSEYADGGGSVGDGKGE